MSNIMNLKGFRNSVSRNGFDLSRRNLFTAKVGELLPVMCVECLPGDKFNIKQQWFSRTVPVKSPAYTRIREYYDYFFVPDRLLWRYSDAFFTPTGVNQFATSINDNSVSPTEMPFTTTKTLVSYLSWMQANFEDKETYAFDVIGMPRYVQTAKLLNYLGYGNLQFDSSYFKDVNVGLLPILAYQKIYQDYFRDNQWENSHPEFYNIDYCTGGSFSTYLTENLIDATNTDCMFDLRYCNWNKDMFFGVLPSAQFGDVATVSSDSLNLDPVTISIGDGSPAQMIHTKAMNVPTSQNNVLYQVGNSSDYSRGTLSLGVSNPVTRITASNSSISSLSSSQSSLFSVLALRKAEALQKYKEITQANKYDYKSQIQAHWNVHVSEERSNICHYIGGHVGNISVSEVVNTSLSSEDESALIQGKGVGDGSGSLSFEAHEHGVLMCIYHAIPLVDWSSVGLKPLCSKYQQEDFAIPVFDKLGMEVVPTYLMSLNSKSPQSTLGYAPRYFDYKTAIDETHGAFLDTLSDWTANLTESYLTDLIGSSPINYSFFKVNPYILYYIFGVNPIADGTIDSDQLRNNCYFDIKAVRNLDYNGLPY